MDKVAEGAARLVPLDSGTKRREAGAQHIFPIFFHNNHLKQSAGAEVHSLGMGLCVLDLLSAGVELQQVVPHGQLVAELSDLAGPQAAGETPARHKHANTQSRPPPPSLPPPWRFQAARPAFHCGSSTPGSASAATGQSGPPAPGPALSAGTDGGEKSVEDIL